MNFEKETDWEVRVYLADNDVDPIVKWIIENRTEDAATREAAADIATEYPDAADWSLTEVASDV